MTRGLLEDFKRHAANNERERILEMFRNIGSTCADWAVDTIELNESK